MTLKLRLWLSICALLVSGYACAQPSSASLTIAVDAHGEWQGTGMTFNAGDDVVIEYLDGEWTNWLDELPLIGYPQGGLIGRIGFGDPFGVGEYVALTAGDDGMLQLRMNDTGTVDNKGSVLTRVSLNTADECGVWLDTGLSDLAFSFDFTVGCV